ncbi:DUF2934 domain-containing protein [Caballeronia sp. ATUFL_F2_KS9A]|uniref:DUF2934 domain-containing protein n=1 Tax=Caballeronia sp. ATUFL_F2_KS9A TaxID=2921777 RepID=UPI00202856B6|nr:DUF2934 domain-containing protein [Caballeronia sp. ATUFL_F2_KS9A]
MDVPASEEQIRALAYRLWEEAGGPEGRSDEFWIVAQQQLATEPGMGGNELPGGEPAGASPSSR